MRPAEVTTEQIIEAGKFLAESGRNITGFALRQKIGGGNPTRLRQIWEEHQAGQAAVKVEPVAELPIEVAEEVTTVTAELTARLARLALELNDKAVKTAERRVAEVVRAAGEQREQAERELVDAGQAVEDLENNLEAAQVAGAELDKQLTVSKELAQQQAVELAQLRERLVANEVAAKRSTEAHAAELAVVQANVAELNGQLSQAQQKISVAAQDHAVVVSKLEASDVAAKRAAEAHAAELAAAQTSIAELNGHLALAQQKIGVAAQDHAVVLSKLEAALLSVAETEKRLSAVNHELAAERLQVQSKQSALDAAAKAVEEAKEVVKESRTEARKAVEEAAELRGRLSAIESAHKLATEAATAAVSEAAELRGRLEALKKQADLPKS